MITLFLMRHGETWANRLGILQGTLDNQLSSLTTTSQQLARQSQYLLAKYRIDQIITSPLLRAQQTSTLIRGESKIPIVTDSRLSEISYGTWNGELLVKLGQQFNGYIDQATNDVMPSANCVNGGESYAHAQRRINAFLREIAEQTTQQNVLVVTHGWIIKTLVAEGLNVPQANFNNPANLSLTKIIIEKAPYSFRLCYYNHQLRAEN